MSFKSRWIGGLAAGVAVSLAVVTAQGQQPRQVDDAMLLKPADGDWITYGRDQAETHHSPLKQIDQIERRPPRPSRGQPRSAPKASSRPRRWCSTACSYGTSTWSKVYAIDLRTGKLKWQWDPGLVRAGYEADGPRACCGPVNRGVALYKGRVYVGLLDGRLVALNAQTGLPEWAVQTTPPGTDYTITGAPRVIKGRVVIGQGGAEYGVRGFLAAYDAETGKLAWKFYTVPGDPAKAFEDEALRARREDLGGPVVEGRRRRHAVGRHCLRPELNLIYVGTGNGSPWNAQHRSPGGGDNLYLSSIVALNADTGKYVWHYQTTPGDNWDYNAAQPMILADLTIGNQPRKVIMQAPKNGFFYVLDRADGKLISGEPFAFTSWATGIDMKTGRPIETERRAIATRRCGCRRHRSARTTGRRWPYNPTTGLVYYPGPGNQHGRGDGREVRIQGRAVEPRHAHGHAPGADGTAPPPPVDPKAPPMGGFFVAWDPVRRRPHGRFRSSRAAARSRPRVS